MFQSALDGEGADRQLYLVAAGGVLTVFAIVVTANHWFLDAIGGFFVLAVGYGLARLVTKAGRGPAIDVRVDTTAA